MLLRVVYKKFTDVSEILTASIIRAMSGSEKTAVCTLVAVRTWNLSLSHV
jgi:hypothetical protein